MSPARKRAFSQNKITSVRVKSFKGIQDSGPIKLGLLTVFVGNNGSGKSSLIEAVEFMHDVVSTDLDAALTRWRGIEHVWNSRQPHSLRHGKSEFNYHTNPVFIRIEGTEEGRSFAQELTVNASDGWNEVFIQQEREIVAGKVYFQRDDDGYLKLPGLPRDHAEWMGEDKHYPPGVSCFVDNGSSVVFKSGFYDLQPDGMGRPSLKHRAIKQSRLQKDGSNLSEYLEDLRERSREAFDEVIESMKSVLPYMADIQPSQAMQLERRSFLEMAEGETKHAGWMLSTGTVRILAFLALLHDPNPPPVIFIEEIENGLDPRTIEMLIGQIRTAIEAKRIQVIATTHSPYLLNHLAHEHIVLVERDQTGEPKFIRPENIAELTKWREKYSPGKLYTDILLNRKNV